MSKRQPESYDNINETNKRQKINENTENDYIPIEFGNNKTKWKNVNKSNFDTIGFARNTIPIIDKDANLNPYDDQISAEQRVTMQELDRLEKQQEIEFDNWKKKEEIFEFKQAILRSKLRLENNSRIKPIDTVAHLYLILDKHMAITKSFITEKLKYPYKLFGDLKYEDLKQL